MRNNFSQEQLHQSSRFNVFRACGGQYNRDEEAYETSDGETYDEAEDLPEDAFRCTINDVEVDARGDTITVDDGDDRYELGQFGESHQGVAGLTLSDSDNVYRISEDQFSVTPHEEMSGTGRSLPAPRYPDSVVVEMCESIESKTSLVPYDDGSVRPGLACHIESAGGRDRFIRDGKHIDELTDGEVRVIFGQERGSRSVGRSKYVESEQGSFDAKKEPPDGRTKGLELDATTGRVLRDDFYAD